MPQHVGGHATALRTIPQLDAADAQKSCRLVDIPIAFKFLTDGVRRTPGSLNFH